MSATSIPAFHVSDISKARGSGEVFIQSRKDAVSSGIFSVRLDVHFDPSTDDYPAGSLTIKVDLSDSVKGTFTAASIELINKNLLRFEQSCLNDIRSTFQAIHTSDARDDAAVNMIC